MLTDCRVYMNAQYNSNTLAIDGPMYAMSNGRLRPPSASDQAPRIIEDIMPGAQRNIRMYMCNVATSY